MMGIHAHKLGQPSHPWLVMIHGWGMDSDVLRPLAERLSENFRIALLDLPGHGKSRPYATSDTPLDDWAHALANAAPKPAVWLGWSLGGMPALRIAAQRPEHVTALGLLAATPSFTVREDWPHGVDFTVLTGFQEAIAVNPAKALARFASLQVRGDASASRQLRWLRRHLATFTPPDDQALADGLRILTQMDLREDLVTLRQPAMALLGAQDTLMPAGAAQDMLALKPDMQIQVLENAAHLPFLGSLENVAQHLQNFFRETLSL